jgi:hypothetical protein
MALKCHLYVSRKRNRICHLVTFNQNENSGRVYSVKWRKEPEENFLVSRQVKNQSPMFTRICSVPRLNNVIVMHACALQYFIVTFSATVCVSSFHILIIADFGMTFLNNSKEHSPP